MKRVVENIDVGVAGRSLHWERGLKPRLLRGMDNRRRSLHWERGLKRHSRSCERGDGRSLPSLGAWIETTSPTELDASPFCRSLHWERGLKLDCRNARACAVSSLPSLGAWIETRLSDLAFPSMRSLPSLGAWIETKTFKPESKSVGRSLHWERGLKQTLYRDAWCSETSLPSLGAWIETT